jgi:protocatechuate 3,4-dioxygenase beta subunit
MRPKTSNETRRSFLAKLLAIPAGIIAFVWGGQSLTNSLAQTVTRTPTRTPGTTRTTRVPPTPTATPTLLPTPTCGDDDDDEPTISQTEGPFYTPDSPERTSFIEEDTVGTRMVVAGFVLNTRCEPVPGAMLDFWHADNDGVYDNEGYRLRGHFFSDDEGRWSLETIVPGLYPGRTRHFHVKVQAPRQSILTTQLYFPDEPDNARDGIFNEALIMEVEDTDDEDKHAFFNFVLDI